MKNGFLTLTFITAVVVAGAAAASTPEPHHRYLVRVSSPKFGEGEAKALAGRHHGKVLHFFQHVMHGFVVELSDRDAAAMKAEPRVASVELDGLVRVRPLAVQTGAVVNWALDRIDQRSGLDSSFTYNKTGAGVRVYVVDSGISENGDNPVVINGYTCCTLPDHINPDPPHDTVWNTTPDYSDVYCQTSGAPCHGTKVANLIAGWTYGVAKNATLINVRVIKKDFDFGTQLFIGDEMQHLSDINAGIEWAISDHQTHPSQPAVMNISIDWSTNPDINCPTCPSACPSCGRLLDQAVINAIDSGIVVVAGAGNYENYSPNSNEGDCMGSMPARLGSLDGSAIDGLNNPHNRTTITVSAISQDDTRIKNANDGGKYWTANVGTCVDIFAPGYAAARGTQLPDFFSGTSAAAPLVTGVVAQYLEGKGSNYDPNDVETVLKRNATVVTNPFTNLIVYSRVDLWQ